jgi:hypothetical protein
MGKIDEVMDDAAVAHLDRLDQFFNRGGIIGGNILCHRTLSAAKPENTWSGYEARGLAIFCLSPLSPYLFPKVLYRRF